MNRYGKGPLLLRYGRVLACLLLGCGGTASTESGPSVDEYGAYAARAFCAQLSTCCDAARLRYGSIHYDGEACLSQMTDYFQAPIAAATKNGRAQYKRAIADACVQSIADREAQCADDLLLPISHDFGKPDPCADLLIGSIEPGDACAVNAECARQPGVPSSFVSCIDPKYAGITGATGTICYRVRYDAQIGEACGRNGAERTFCDPLTSVCDSGVCIPYIALGGACTLGGCQPSSAFCDLTKKVCVPAIEEGGTCGGDLACNSDHVLSCDEATSTCVPITLTDGSLCDQQSSCARGQSCLSGICRTVGESHVRDVSPRSCGLGPLSIGSEHKTGL